MHGYYTAFIKPTYSVIKYVCTAEKKRSRAPLSFTTSHRIRSNDNLKQNSHQGLMSKKAQQRIKNAVNWLVMSAPRKKVFNARTKQSYYYTIGMITLTLSAKQKHTDTELKRILLQKFLDYGRKTWLLSNYIWKAETQSNGNLHFHIITDTFIHKKAVTAIWNNYLESAGYPPSKSATRIESIRKINDIGAYIAKYMSKNEKDRRKVTGKLWGSSESLSEKNTKLTIDTENPSELYTDIMNSATSQTKEIISYKPTDTEKEHGFFVGSLLLYKWQNFLKRARSELAECIKAICYSINPPSQQLNIIYNS